MSWFWKGAASSSGGGIATSRPGAGGAASSTIARSASTNLSPFGPVESPARALLRLLRSPAMDEAFPVDPDIPQLAIASDPGLMLEVFRTYLRPLTRETYHIQDCQVSRIRYRRGTRCVL